MAKVTYRRLPPDDPIYTEGACVHSVKSLAELKQLAEQIGSATRRRETASPNPAPPVAARSARRSPAEAASTRYRYTASRVVARLCGVLARIDRHGRA
jgi:hypothetical protein